MPRALLSCVLSSCIFALTLVFAVDAAAANRVLVSAPEPLPEPRQAHARLMKELSVEGYSVTVMARGWQCDATLRGRLARVNALAAVQVDFHDGLLSTRMCLLHPHNGRLIDASPHEPTQDPELLSMTVLEALHGASLQREQPPPLPQPSVEIRTEYIERRVDRGFSLKLGSKGLWSAAEVDALVGAEFGGEYTFREGLRIGLEANGLFLGGDYPLGEPGQSTSLQLASARARLGYVWATRVALPFITAGAGVLFAWNAGGSIQLEQDTAVLPLVVANFGVDIPLSKWLIRAELGVASLTRAMQLRRGQQSTIAFGTPFSEAGIALGHAF